MKDEASATDSGDMRAAIERLQADVTALTKSVAELVSTLAAHEEMVFTKQLVVRNHAGEHALVLTADEDGCGMVGVYARGVPRAGLHVADDGCGRLDLSSELDSEGRPKTCHSFGPRFDDDPVDTALTR
jgi:hypothetical protein